MNTVEKTEINNSFVKDFWAKSQVSLVKIIVTAVAAISMSYISTKLNDYKGIYLTGIIAVVSLILNEIYNFIFQWVQYKTIKTVQKVETVHKKETPVRQDTGKEIEEESEKEEPKDLYPSRVKKSKKNLFQKVWNYINAHQTVRLIIFFLLVSITVLGINYMNPKVQQNISPMVTIDVDNETKQAIIDEAVKKAQDGGENPWENILPEKPDNEEHSEAIDELRKSHEETVNNLEYTQESHEDLLQNYENLSEEVDELKNRVRDLTIENNELTEKLIDIEEVVSTLTERIESLS